MRLLTNLLLILVLPATHIVPLAHKHEVGELPVDHHARPHIHLHGHEHEQHDHAHHGHDHAQEIDEAVRGVLCGLCRADHDDDAIYVETQLSIAAIAEGRIEAVGAPEFVALVAAWSASVVLSQPDAIAEPPPRIRIDGPPLYLRNLSLRI